MKYFILFKRDIYDGIMFCLLISSVLLAGCASMQSSTEELENLKENEGIIIGSALITVEESKKEESYFAWLKGQKASGAEYDLLLEASDASFNPFSITYSITITPGEESVFIKKLPAGDYLISKFHKRGISSGLHAYIGAKLTVAPGESTYVGKLVVNIPHRLQMGSEYMIVIQDDQDKTLSSLNEEYQSILSSVTKNLMIAK